MTLRFLTDSMLGKLTRWLRMLGHNVKYGSNLEDRALIKIAKKEERILLTRDLELFRHATTQHAQAFFIGETKEPQRLANLSKQFNLHLDLDPNNSRCPKCNAKIRPVKKSKIADKIPAATKIYYAKFWECLQCGKIYWQGAHWKKITNILEEAKQIPKSD